MPFGGRVAARWMGVWLLVATFRGAGRVRTRAAREPGLRDLVVLAAGVQIALVAFAVESFFHPVAYQFYFFCIGGLAVALQNTCRTELAMAPAGPDEADQLQPGVAAPLVIAVASAAPRHGGRGALAVVLR